MTRRLPWAEVLGWTALVLAGIAAVGVAVAASAAIQGARDPQSWGDLVAAVLVVYALVPSVLALVVAIVQARRGWAPRWRTRTTLVLAALAPVAAAVLAVGALLG
ncbi:hypothetical protein [Cellulomonas sp.]|uniref:hypothetical protein n=1 Tax=Cellulomonas sp. TaxID=40001 RepID=UPI003BABC9F4